MVAHPDDLELLVPGVIGACRRDPARSFTGVVCASGAVEAGVGGLPPVTAGTRRLEQAAAADLGRYGAVAMLGHASASLRGDPGRADVVAEVADLLGRCRPDVVYTHDLADRHATHVAVATIVVDALRTLSPEARPRRLLACEGWRSLDWLDEDERVHLDVTGHEELARDLLATHASQVAAKRYDVAASGRRRANATFADPRSLDRSTELVLAMDLTALLADDDLDPAALVDDALGRFRDRVLSRLADPAGGA